MKSKIPAPHHHPVRTPAHTELSAINIFSQIESGFLQKYFRYNISDYFQNLFSALEPQSVNPKPNNKNMNELASLLFQTKVGFSLKKFEQYVNRFYLDKSKCQDLSYCFKHLYSNVPSPDSFQFGQKQLAVFQVKIKAEVQKIQAFPIEFYKQLQLSRFESCISSQQELTARLKAYSKNVIHLFIIYYGDANFDIFKKQNYKPRTVNFFQKEVEVNIHVFYISRMALVETFNRISKIQSKQGLNELAMQLYQFKRDNLRRKRKRAVSLPNKQQGLKQKGQKEKDLANFLKWVTLFSISGLTIGTFLFKYVH